MQIIDKILEKLKASAERPYLLKRFDFTLEDVQDDPNYLLRIVEYLEQHNGKWIDFEIMAQVDSNTFAPYVLIKMYLSDETTFLKNNINKNV